MAWMERGLQISLKRYTLSMEDKMAAGIVFVATVLFFHVTVDGTVVM